MTTNFTVLLLNAGRRVELVRCFRSAFEQLGVRGRIIATDINGLAPALYQADGRYLLPHSSHPEFVDRLLEVCHGEEVGLVVPLIDPDLLVLAANRETIESSGVQLLISDKRVIEICDDKQKTHDFLLDNGILTASTMSLEEARGRHLPLFIKPRKGSGSESAYRVDTLDELEFFAKYVPDALIQDFIEGYEVTTDVFCDWASKPVAAIARRRLKVRAGEVSVGRIVRIQGLEDLCKRVAEDIGAIGPVNIQAICSDGAFHVIEINPRFGGGCPLSIAAGAPLTEWVIQMGLGQPLAGQRSRVSDGLTMLRFEDSMFCPAEEFLS